MSNPLDLIPLDILTPLLLAMVAAVMILLASEVHSLSKQFAVRSSAIRDPSPNPAERNERGFNSRPTSSTVRVVEEPDLEGLLSIGSVPTSTATSPPATPPPTTSLATVSLEKKTEKTEKKEPKSFNMEDLINA
jgi:hypothetical protein